MINKDLIEGGANIEGKVVVVFLFCFVFSGTPGISTTYKKMTLNWLIPYFQCKICQALLK